MSKILYAASTLSHINNFHLPYIEKLREEGHTVKVMASGKGADFNIPFVKSLLSLKNLFSCRKIKKILKQESFDAIILNTTLAAFYIRSALPNKNRPKVVNIVHGYLFSQKGGLKSRLLLFCEKLMRKKTDTVIVMNGEDMDIATKNRLSINGVKMTRGMGAVAADQKFDVEIIRRYTASEGKFLMTFVGEICSRKNQRFLICALPEIKLSIPKAALMFVGAGAEEMTLRDLANKLGIDSSVHFVGSRNNPCDFIRSSDLYVSASKIEGMPFNVIEALACGKPILASDIKGHRELIENGKEGFLFDPASVSDFVNKVKKIYSGEFSFDKESQIAKYTEYSLPSVFEETYAAIRSEVV